MDKKIKERIFGAVVLVALATIFLPMIFTGPHEAVDINLNENMPMPKIDTKRPFIPKDLSRLQEESQKEETILAEEDEIVSKDHQLGALEPSEAWAIQVATFNKIDNAHKLRDKLLDAGFPAYVKMSGDGENVVLIGPEIDSTEAEKLLEKVNQQFKVKGVMVKYHPARLTRSR